MNCSMKKKRIRSWRRFSTGRPARLVAAPICGRDVYKRQVLVIDELDSSLHFKLTRAIAAMFNNELNRSAQLIFTVHDINLLDCKKLFRKEQIWFIDKDQAGVYLYSLADFTALKGVRDNSDILSKYQKGIFGAVPEPELIKSLLDLDIHTGNQGE